MSFLHFRFTYSFTHHFLLFCFTTLLIFHSRLKTYGIAEFAGLKFAGLENDGLENDGLEIDGLENDALE